MDESTKQEITRLLLEQVELDKVGKYRVIVTGKPSPAYDLIDASPDSVYGKLPAVWSIPLYLARN